MAEIISGRDIAAKIIETDLVPRVQTLNKKGVQPKLVVIFVGEHAASESYVRQKEKFAEKAGILSEVRRFESTMTEEELLSEIDAINADDSIHGVIVQLPLPDHISVKKVVNRIATKKDVDGFTAENIGKLVQGEPCLECCTPKGIIRMIEEAGEDLSGARVVVIGRSNVVGKPVAALALNKNATVTICHSRTKNLNEQLEKADIIIVAVGRPEFLHGDQIPKGATIIDVGIHRKDDGKLCGDVHFESAEKVAGKISPVPRGVGPMTVVSLIENTIEAAEATV